MPYTVRTLTGSLSDLLHPSFRKITFDDSPAVVLVSTHLRQAWSALPQEDTSGNAIRSFIVANHKRSEEERNAVPKNPDSNDIHTPWREAIYYHWNHLFYDIANFLAEVGPGMGSLDPPAHEVLAVNYPEPVVGGGEVEVGVKVVWKTNVLVLPAHLESKISLRMVEMGAEVEEGRAGTKTVGTFDGSNGTEIWFFREGTEVRVFVEGEYEKDRRGVAALLVYGKLTTTLLEEEGEQYQQGGNEEEQKY